MQVLTLTAAAATTTVAAKPPHILFVVGDDVGYSDFGILNDYKTITPTIDGLIESGITLSDYYTFKCARGARTGGGGGAHPAQDLQPVPGRHDDGAVPLGRGVLRYEPRYRSLHSQLDAPAAAAEAVGVQDGGPG